LQELNARGAVHDVGSLVAHHDAREHAENEGEQEDANGTQDLLFIQAQRYPRPCLRQERRRGLNYVVSYEEGLGSPARSRRIRCHPQPYGNHGHPALNIHVEHEQHEKLLVTEADAIVDPGAVVVHPHDAPPAYTAMMRFGGLRRLALLAHPLTIFDRNVLGQRARVREHGHQVGPHRQHEARFVKESPHDRPELALRPSSHAKHDIIGAEEE